ncbi:MAG: hypothetical protein IT393_00685 [Nitrospirae bacterium]|nr:hypothetical protein [Nitrospirota bacterium]
MTLINQLKDYLLHERVISVKDKDRISISLLVGDAPKREDALSRRYIISKDYKPVLSVKFLPAPWRFSYDDILQTRALYSKLESFRVPQLVGHFSNTDGIFFVEEYINSAVTLADLIKIGDLNSKKAIEVIRSILFEIWSVSEPAGKEFIIKEIKNYKSYLQYLIQESYLLDNIMESIERLIEANAENFRQAWSTGDIMDRNILLSDKNWYLIDFDYCHQTLFLFKEAYRNILYANWAENTTVHEIAPWLGKFPEELATILSLAWEKHLYAEILDKQANKVYESYLRKLAWDILYPQINKIEESLKEKEHEVVKLQKEIGHIKESPAWRLLKKTKSIKDKIF